MSSPAGSGIELPVVTGDHVRYVLEQGRSNQAALVRQEREWLGTRNPRLGTDIIRMYNLSIELNGRRDITRPDAFLAGAMMGHRVVRYACLQTGANYEVSAEQFRINQAREQFRPDISIPWATEPVLRTVFGDQNDVPEALMEIAHDNARDGAAFIIAYSTLPSIPSVLTAVAGDHVTTRATTEVR